MKGWKYGFDNSGQIVVALWIDGDQVRIISEKKEIKALVGKALEKKVAVEAKGIIGDGREILKPGDAGYPDAVIDTLEGMGIDVVG